MPNRRAVLAGMTATLLATGTGVSAKGRRRVLHDGFRDGLGQWVIEAEKPSTVTATGGVLDIVAPGGLTVWFRPILSGAVKIDYDVRAIQAGGPFDRVSDVNCFWMAQDPKAPDRDVLAHPRSGRFEDYDELETYYVGLGGNTNSTTRFRRYIGRSGDRPIRPENDRRAAEDLLVPNAWQHLRVSADGPAIRFARDGRTLFDFQDPAPYTRGRFGLRTTASHLQLRNFTVVAID
jgi:hypothetical protein